MSVLLLIPTVVRSPTAWRAQWETALTSVTTAPAKVLCIGDSVTEGQGASTKAKRWTDLLTGYLHVKYPTGVTGGAGYIAPETANYGPDSPWTTYASQSGTISLATTVGDPGYRASQMSTAAVRTYNVTGTSVDIWWLRNTGAGSFTWAVDGGSATTVSTAGTRSTTTKTTVSLGTSGAHTLTLTATTGPVTLTGLTVYDGDETFGCQLFEAGHTAWKTTDYIQNTDYTAFKAFVAAIAPDLVMIQLGLNDYGGGGTPANYVTSSTYQTNMLQLCSDLEALTKKPSLLVIDSYDFATNASNPEAQSAYTTVLQAVVNANPDNRGYINFGSTMPPTNTPGTTYYRSDLVHPNDSGHAEIYRQLRYIITPYAQPGTQTETATVIDSASQPGTSSATTLATEPWTGTTGGSWPAQWTITANTGAATIQANTGRLNTTVATAYVAGPRGYLSGMTATADTDLTFTFTPSSIAEQYGFISVRADGTVGAEGYYPTNGYFVTISYGVNTFDVTRSVAASRTNLTTGVPITLTAATAYKMRFRVIGAQVSVRFWLASAAEPTTWHYDAADGTPYLTAGKVQLQHNNGATGPYTVDFDDLTVTDGATGPEVLPAGHTALNYWYAGVEYRKLMPATWLAIGDSITEGQGASTRANRWLDVAMATIRSKYPVTAVNGGVGFLPGYYAVFGPDSTWQPYTSRTGTIANDTTLAGFGERAADLAVAATQTYTITGDAFDLWWLSNGGTLTVTVDGTAYPSIDTTGTYSSDHRTSYYLGATGSHTVVIGCTVATSFLAGIQVYDGDSTVGIRAIDSAHTTWTSTQFMDTNFVPAWGLAAPDLVTIALGTNDPGASITPATTKSNVQTIISQIRAAVPNNPPSIAVIIMYATNAQGTATWTPYANALRTIATEDPTIGIIDFFATMGVAGTSGNFSSDGIHPSNAGHTVMANQVSTYLTETVNPNGYANTPLEAVSRPFARPRAALF